MTRLAMLRRYATIIAGMIPSETPVVINTEDRSRVQVERGLMLPPVDLPSGLAVTVVDACGHARGVYRPLLVYVWLMKTGARDHREMLMPWVESIGVQAGGEAAVAAWGALVHAVAGELFQVDTWLKSARSFFVAMIDRQQPGGCFLPENASVNPETRWFDELLLLHALSSYAVRVRDARMDRAVERAAAHHLHETQPDHASAQPWGLMAFVQYAPPLADQVLHALSTLRPCGVTGVPLLLLTDALYGLTRLIERDALDETDFPATTREPD